MTICIDLVCRVHYFPGNKLTANFNFGPTKFRLDDVLVSQKAMKPNVAARVVSRSGIFKNHPVEMK